LRGSQASVASASGVRGRRDADFLESAYREWNHRERVHPDPLEFVYAYDDPGDREVAGLIAASLAYGRVGQILASVSVALEPLTSAPRAFVAEARPREFREAFRGFRHRFTTGDDLAGLLAGAGALLRRWGSLETAFTSRVRPEHASTVPALCAFASELSQAAGRPGGNVLPSPDRGSACKRLHLFLRWMARRDEVDPGVWTTLSPALLVVPLDVHMHRIARGLGATDRKQADLAAALETTEWFRRFSPDDPAKYDFALTRLAMRGEFPRRQRRNRC